MKSLKSGLPKVGALTLLLGGLMTLYAANAASVYLFGYPFLYCGTADTVAAVYLAWGTLVYYGCIIAGMFFIWRVNVKGILFCALLFTFVVELPKLAASVFKLGGSCV